MPRRHLAVLLVAAAADLFAPVARAQGFPPIEDRNYTLDLYQGAVLGSVQVVGMGRAAVATAVGSTGSIFNPAAVAARVRVGARPISRARWYLLGAVPVPRRRWTAIPGRLHGTIGLDLRVWSFCLWRWHDRVRLSLTADVAAQYRNSGLSIGYWH